MRTMKPCGLIFLAFLVLLGISHNGVDAAEDSFQEELTKLRAEVIEQRHANSRLSSENSKLRSEATELRAKAMEKRSSTTEVQKQKAQGLGAPSRQLLQSNIVAAATAATAAANAVVSCTGDDCPYGIHDDGNKTVKTDFGIVDGKVTEKWWKQCISEGGPFNCAKCMTDPPEKGDGAGVLRCGSVDPSKKFKPSKKKCYMYIKPDGNWPYKNKGPCRKIEDCPDNLGRGAVWLINPNSGQSVCNKFIPSPAGGVSVFCRKNDKFLPDLRAEQPDLDSDGNIPNPNKQDCSIGTSVVQSQASAHPSRAKEKVGAIMFKRTIFHDHTSKTDRFGNPLRVADEYKVGVCVDCTGSGSGWGGFSHVDAWQVFLASDHVAQHNEFLGKCVKKVMGDDGTIKQSNRCVGIDNAFFTAAFGGF